MYRSYSSYLAAEYSVLSIILITIVILAVFVAGTRSVFEHFELSTGSRLANEHLHYSPNDPSRRAIPLLIPVYDRPEMLQ